jgi:cytoskeletal protein CcmA (bactofilin family)
MAAAGATTGGVPTADLPPTVPTPLVVDRGTVRHAELRAIRWRVRGISKVDRDATAGQADLGGTVIVGGRLSVGSAEVDGSLEVRGAATASDRLRLRGTLTAAATVRGRQVELEGRLRVVGELSAESALRLRGSMDLGSVRAATVDLRGSGHVRGPIDVGSADLLLTGDAQLGEIRARSLRARGPVPNPVRWALGQETQVVVERIEADTVYLEGLRATFVRSPEIRLGPAAHLLAYEGRVLRAHRTSRVGLESWSQPPTGLRR